MILRSLAMFFACLSAIGLFARLTGAAFDPTSLWINLQAFSPAAGLLLLCISAAGLAMIGLGAGRRAWAAVPIVLAGIATVDAGRFYALLTYGRIESSFPIALSLLIAIGMGCIARRQVRSRSPSAEPSRQTPLPEGPAGSLPDPSADPPADPSPDPRPGSPSTPPRSWFALLRSPATGVVLLAGWCVAFALLQMWCYGKTDYARKADAIVVLGARVYSDGRLSDALADRVRTGVRLYQEGLAPRLILSGGPGDGAIDEPAAMRDFAIALGVPAAAIEEDNQGINTRATIHYLAEHHAGERLLAVSHFYHLPRIKLAADQQRVRIVTSPATETYTLSQMPRYIAREVAAFWVYLLR